MIWKVERDICFLYHELREWVTIYDDLSWGRMYALPYWDFVNIGSGADEFGATIDEETRCFVRDGCLIMILGMCWEIICGSGSYSQDKIETCKAAVSEISPDDANTAKLILTVRMALDATARPRAYFIENYELEQLSIWVHQEYVRGYFRRMAEKKPFHF